MRNNPRRRNKQKANKVKLIKFTKQQKIMFCIVLLLFLFSIMFAILNLQNTKIIGGVCIEGIDVSNMSKDEVKELFTEIIDQKMFDAFIFEYEEKDYVIEPSLLGISYNINDVLDEAFKLGRSGNLIKDNFDIIKSKLFGINYHFNATYDKEKLDMQIKQVYAQLPGTFLEGSYYIENLDLILNKEVSGIIINEDKFYQYIGEYIKDFTGEISAFYIPVEIKEAKDINVAQIHSEIYVQEADAYYTKSPFKIYPQVEGVNFAVSEEAVQEILSKTNEKNEYVIPLKITKPKVTISDLDIDAFPDLVASASSRYDVANENRSTNLEIVAKKLDGYIIAPGEIFSYNKVVGARTIAEGYKEAPIYTGGKVELGLGGGICQVSSMLYEASLDCNLKIIERTNHQFLPSYAEPGLDATVVYGSIDYKFQNNRTYPIKISVTARKR